MGMKICPFCAEEIQEAAVVCKHCGRELPADAPTKRAPKRGGCLILLGALLGLLFIGFILFLLAPRGSDPRVTSQRERPSTKSVTPQVQEDVAFLREKGLIVRLNVDLNEAYVDPVLWAGLNIDTKRNVAQTISRYFDAQGSTGRVTFIDHQSGRRLARWSSLGGLSIEP